MDYLISDSDRIKLRKSSKNVVINGLGVLMFGAWSFIKIVLMYLYKPEYSSLLFRNIYSEMGSLKIIYLILAALLAAFGSWFHFFIGIQAMKYGKDKSDKKGFLVLAAILLLGTMLSVAISIVSIFLNKPDDEFLVSVMADVTLIVLLIDLFYSTFTVSKIRKKGSI